MADSTTRTVIAQNHDRIPDPNEDQTPGAATGNYNKPPSLDTDITIGQKMLSAVSGSVLTSLLVTPLDVVRVRLQSQNPASQASSFRDAATSSSLSRSFSNLPPNLGVTACCREVFWVNNNTTFCVASSDIAHVRDAAAQGAECAAEEAQRRSFNSTFDGLRKIARNEGLTTLWRGLSPTLAMAVPGNVIYFAGYDWLRTSQYSPMVGRVSDAYAPLVAGSSARVFAALFVSPIELFRTRMQASSSATAAQTFYNTLRGVREMVASNGYHTLWRGLTLTLWRDVPFSAFYWWGYETGRNLLTDTRERLAGRFKEPSGSIARRRSDSRSRQNHSSTLVDSFVAGAVSGGVASVVTTPFDVGKTRQQVYEQSGDRPAGKGLGAARALAPEELSMPRLLLHIFKEEGLSGLFRGWGARCLKVAPACAIMISSYEIGKKFAQGIKKEDQDSA